MQCISGLRMMIEYGETNSEEEGAGEEEEEAEEANKSIIKNKQNNSTRKESKGKEIETDDNNNNNNNNNTTNIEKDPASSNTSNSNNRSEGIDLTGDNNSIGEDSLNDEESEEDEDDDVDDDEEKPLDIYYDTKALTGIPSDYKDRLDNGGNEGNVHLSFVPYPSIHPTKSNPPCFFLYLLSLLILVKNLLKVDPHISRFFSLYYGNDDNI